MPDNIICPSIPARQEKFSTSLFAGVGYFFATSLIVWLSVLFATEFVILCRTHPSAHAAPFFERFLTWDGEWYAKIVDAGYSYDPEQQSNVAFFPGYPLLAGLLTRIAPVNSTHALIIVSHLSLCCAFIIAHLYVRKRWNDATLQTADFVLLVMGLFPATFYFRMAYTESLFLLLIILTLFGMQRKWPLICIAAIVGCATAVRSVGIALLAPLLIHALLTSSTWRQGILRAVCVLPVATAGLLMYSCYLWSTFNDPLAFATVQRNWKINGAFSASELERLFRLLTLAPIREVYTEGCSCHWSLAHPRDNAFFNFHFANPIVFLIATTTVIWGAKARWLDLREVSMAFALLMIPYVLQSDRMCMASQARFASVVFPFYMVLGRLLSGFPPPAQVVIVSISTFLLTIYTALFTSWYWFF